MVLVNAYCTLAELQESNKANQAVDVPVLERAINACARGIDKHCQRHFYQVTEARRFDTCDPLVLMLGAFNDVVSATSVKTDEDADGTFETTWAASDYQLLPLNVNAAPETKPYNSILAVGSRSFPLRSDRRRRGLVELLGIWGWPGTGATPDLYVPHGVKQANILHAARIFNRKESPQGVAGWGDFGAIRLGRTDPDVIAFLDPYWNGAGVGV